MPRRSRKKKIDDEEEPIKEFSGGDATELQVLPVVPTGDEEGDYHPHLPSIARHHGSITLLIGPTASGKSVMINNLLLNKNFYGAGDGKKPAFDPECVHVFSPSIFMDDSARFMLDSFNCYPGFEDHILRDIMAKQEEYGKAAPKVMIVIDDSVGQIDRNGLLNHFISRYRHWNCNLIISVQYFKALSMITRTNCTDVVLMNGIFNEAEFEKIEDEWSGIYKGQLIPYYHKYTQEPYSFLYCKLRKKMLFSNFTKRIY